MGALKQLESDDGTSKNWAFALIGETLNGYYGFKNETYGVAEKPTIFENPKDFKLYDSRVMGWHKNYHMWNRTRTSYRIESCFRTTWKRRVLGGPLPERKGVDNTSRTERQKTTEYGKI